MENRLKGEGDDNMRGGPMHESPRRGPPGRDDQPPRPPLSPRGTGSRLMALAGMIPEPQIDQNRDGPPGFGGMRRDGPPGMPDRRDGIFGRGPPGRDGPMGMY